MEHLSNKVTTKRWYQPFNITISGLCFNMDNISYTRAVLFIKFIYQKTSFTIPSRGYNFSINPNIWMVTKRTIKTRWQCPVQNISPVQESNTNCTREHSNSHHFDWFQTNMSLFIILVKLVLYNVTLEWNVLCLTYKQGHSDGI